MATNLSHIWQVIEAVRGDPDQLRALLTGATAEQLIYVRRRYVFLADDLLRIPAFSAHDDRERAPALARWVVTRGRAAWRDARHEPDKLPREPPAEFRDLEPVFEEVHRARFGGDLPYLEPDPAGQGDLFHTAEWEQRLWNLIEYLDMGADHEDALEGFTRSQVARLNIEFNHLRAVLWRRFEPVFGDAPRDLDWYEWTDWMISQGRDAYERALARPELAPREVPEDGPMWLCKIVEVYQDRYDEEPPTFPGVREVRAIVLGLIRDDGGKATWHRLATRLPSYRVPPDTDVMQVVEELRVRGWAASTRHADGTERWRITPLGEAALDGKPAPAGVLAPDALARFVAGLRGGAMASAQAVMPYMDDGLKLWAILRQALAADPSATRDIAAAGLYLPRTERGPFARELLDDPRPGVREALLRAWTPVELDAPGKPLPTVPDAELDELLRRGLLDPSPAVREAAAALAYAAMRGASLVPELVVNLGAPEPALRCWSLLALGAASDPVSLDLLRQHATSDDAAEAAAAIRALGQRADGYLAWRYGLQDRRPEVRAAALHALATVLPEVPAEDLARWSADADPELARAAAAHRARRELANSRNPR